MKNKPDDRRDNVEKIQKNINNTIQKIEFAEEMISKANRQKNKDDLVAKNDRRRNAVDGMKKEIKDEAIDKKKGYKQ